MKVYFKIIVLLAVGVTTLVTLWPVRTESRSDHDLVSKEIRQLVELADSLRKRKEINSAILVAETAIEMMEKEEGDFDSLYAYVWMRLGDYYTNKGLPAEASQYYIRCLNLEDSEGWLGRGTIAHITRRLGAQYCSAGRYAEAESTVNHAIQLIQSSPEAGQRELSRCLLELGRIHRCQLRYAEAELNHKKALDVCRSGLEPKFALGLKAGILGSLGNVYFDQGRLGEAESLYIKAFDLALDRWGPEHQNPSEHLDNLGRVRMRQGRYAEAESLCSEALRKRASDIGLDHPWSVYQLLNLSDLCAFRGDYVKAEFYSRLCLRTIDKAGYGEYHPQVARAKRILGDCNRGRGKHLDAKDCYSQALDAFKEVFGRYHPEVAKALESLGLLYASTGDYQKSLAAYEELLESKHFFIDMVFHHASEAQKMRYVSTYPVVDHPLLSLALQDSTGNFQSLALNMALKGKAVVIDALSKEREATKATEDPEVIKTWEQWRKVTDEISVLYISGGDIQQGSGKLAENLWAAKDSLEAELSKHPEFRKSLDETRFEITDIANLIPEQGVLWEFLRYTPFDLSKLKDDPEVTEDARYLGFTLDRAGKVTVTDLGDAQRVDSLIAKVRDHAAPQGDAARFDTEGRLEQQMKQTTEQLYEMIFAPLQLQTPNKTDLIISPDGQLSLLPFEILPCPDGHYVIEKFAISYLSTGRDLLNTEEKTVPTQRAVIIADPDFDLGMKASVGQKGASQRRYTVGPSLLQPVRATNGCLDVPFDPLPNTEVEAESIYSALQRTTGLDVAVYLNAEAREDVLKNMSSPPRILHLATHGFFCEHSDGSLLTEHPLLRSGLLFVSANCSIIGCERDSSQTEDGILTALEASGLDLIGTELVVISACETGVGEVRNGEGVYGLRRAFQHAGAKTIVMSLWRVPSEETCELMTHFYETWSAGKTKKEALREAALKVMNDCRAKYSNTHPYFWGGFVLLGDPN